LKSIAGSGCKDVGVKSMLEEGWAKINGEGSKGDIQGMARLIGTLGTFLGNLELVPLGPKDYHHHLPGLLAQEWAP